MRILIIFLIFPIISVGQKKIGDKELILKGNLISLIDIFSFPTLQLSLEKEINHQLSVSSEVGYQIYNARKVDTSFINPKGWKANFEIRLYDLIDKPTARKRIAKSHLDGTYVGLNLFYRTNNYNSEISYTKSNDSLVHYIDCLGVNKRNWGTNLVLGYQGNISTKFVTDLYFGLGVMKTQITNAHREIREEDRIDGTDLVPLFASWHLSERSGWRANISFGVRLGIKL